MKGFANIKLYDENNSIVLNQDDNNIITNSFSNLIEVCSSLMNNSLNEFGSETISRLTSENLKSFVGGVLLFDHEITENADITVHSKTSNFSGGSLYDNSNPLRGNLNVNETGAVIVDNKKGYRWVWDFSTSCANGTISSLALTTTTAGDREYKLRTPANITNYQSKACNNGFGLCITSNGEKIWSDGKNILTKSFSDTASITTPITLIKDKILFTANNISKNINIFNDEITFVIENQEGEYEYTKFDLINNSVVHKKVIEGAKEKYTSIDVFNTFCECGNDIIFNQRIDGTTFKYDYFDVTTLEISSHELLSCKEFKGSVSTTPVKVDNTIMSTFTYKIYNSSSCNLCTINVFSKNKAEISLEDNDNNARAFVGKTFKPNIGLTHCYNGSPNNGNGVMPYFMHKEPLFTINNLANPITKTNQNTMKVSYTILY